MTNQRNVLIQAAIKAVRLHGMDGVRMQHIGQIAHATPSSIYLYFKGKDELLRVCYEQIDHEIARIFGKINATSNEIITDPEQVIHEAWTSYWKWLLSHPDETIFFHYYRDWSGFPEYDMHRDVSHFDPFVRAVNSFYQHHPGMNSVPPILLWLFWLDGTVMYARYVVQGVFPNSQETENAVFRLLMGGLNGLLTTK